MTRALRRKERDQELRGFAKEAYKNHVIHKERLNPEGPWGNHWIVRNPDSIHYLGEVAVLYGPRLVVHGDIPDVIFGRFSGRYDEILGWVANSGIDYLATKVLTKQYEFDPDIAMQDLKDMQAEVEKEPGEYSENWLEQIKDVIHLFDYTRTEQTLQSAIESFENYEEFSSVGQVINSDIIWCQEMVRKLLELQGHGSEG